jgi:hypothetical protein
MSEAPKQQKEPASVPVDPEEAKFARLRDRTDEIELIISGLTTVALFTLPGLFFETLMNIQSHQSVVTAMGSNVLLILIPGLFYVLGSCFAVHLMIRAYWAGLIGLRTVFPQGIDWQRTPGLGPIGQRYYRDRLPSLSASISKADHLASSLFSVISLIALGMIWTTALIGVVVVGAGLIGSRTGQTNQAVTLATLFMVGGFVGVAALLWLLDAKFGRWFPGLLQRTWYQRLIRGLIRINGWIAPQRLILPVQLTLQSNTRPRLFAFLLAAGIALTLVVGQLVYSSWTQFSLSGEFRYLDDELAREGFRSTYYENLRSSRDRLRFYPMIDDFVQQRSVVSVFLPYFPLRDNLIMDQQCGDEVPPLDCLRGLWQVSLGDRILLPERLIPAERLDLNLRGLIGVVELTGLEPGLHTLEVRWNQGGDASALDDRYEVANRVYSIPFVFAPAYEMGLEPTPDRTSDSDAP